MVDGSSTRNCEVTGNWNAQPSRPEYANLLRFAARSAGAPLEQCVPHVRAQVERTAAIEPADLARYLADGGAPVIVEDAVLSWPALRLWSFEWLREQCGHATLLLNDRAPARRSDALAGPRDQQRSTYMSLSAFAGYVQCLPGSLGGALAAAGGDPLAAPAPFYANGWQAFADAPALSADCPPPAAFSAVDDTCALLGEVEKRLVGDTAGSSGREAARPPLSAAADRLSKVFLGPAGTITRLHHDAASAHGWLAQVRGRKLFVLCPPGDSAYLYPLPGEPGATQSAVDVLDAEVLRRFPLYARARPQAAVLCPGEALLVPAGWWHYAVALEPSVTVMRNFYHRGTNASGLVDLVLEAARAQQQVGN